MLITNKLPRVISVYLSRLASLISAVSKLSMYCSITLGMNKLPVLLYAARPILVFPHFCGQGVKQLPLISRRQLDFYSREKSAVADGYKRSPGNRKYQLWPQLYYGIYDDERAPF